MKHKDLEELAEQFVCYQFSEFTKRCEIDEIRVHIKRIREESK